MKYNDTLQCFKNMFQATQAYEWMNDAHVHEMQVQMWKANTWGVTWCMVCARHTIGAEIVLDALDGTTR